MSALGGTSDTAPSDRDDVDVLAVVFGRVRRVVADVHMAEDAAVAVACRFLTRSGPAWLRSADDAVRLDVLTVLEVLRLRRR